MIFNKAVVVLFCSKSRLKITHHSITFDMHRYLLSRWYYTYENSSYIDDSATVVVGTGYVVVNGVIGVVEETW
jgi:hypothetical protein